MTKLTALTSIRRSPTAKILMPILVIVAVVFGFFFSLPLILNTDTPVRVVESSSMSIPYNTQPGPPYSLDYILLTLMHPFDRTFNVGDIIIIQGVDPKTLNTNYPNSDIIVYKKPTDPTDTPVVHRIVTSYEENGTLYFQTKGDGNGQKWPAVPSSSDYDSNSGVFFGNGQGVPANLVEGKVIMRIPMLGWITLILRYNTWALPAVIGVILLLIVLEFIVPAAKRKKTKPSADQKTVETA